MYRWSNIPDKHRPEIISDINDDKFYALDVRPISGNETLFFRDKKDLEARGAAYYTHRRVPLQLNIELNTMWEGFFYHPLGVFKNAVLNNTPCIKLHEVKNEWAPEINTVICFMNGDTRDIFLIHPWDLYPWDPDCSKILGYIEK